MIGLEELTQEVLNCINERMNDLSLEDRLMALLYVGEHCKAHAQTILAHEYHRALYKPR